MTKTLILYFFPIVASAMFSNAIQRTNADEPLVFISAFAAGDDGAIHAYRLETDTGRLKLVHRTTDVENPFFMAMSSDHRFLYSIHAQTFGGEEHEQVSAYAIEGRAGQLKLLNLDFR